jgi:hypothetical protein
MHFVTFLYEKCHSVSVVYLAIKYTTDAYICVDIAYYVGN